MLLALLGSNLYLRSPGVRQGIMAALERRAGVEVSFRSISYLPWRGVKMSEVVVDHRDDIAGITNAPFVHVDAVVAKIALWSLVDRPIQLRSVHIVGPKVTTLQWPDGSIVFPGSAPEPPAVIALTPGEGDNDPPELVTQVDPSVEAEPGQPGPSDPAVTPAPAGDPGETGPPSGAGAKPPARRPLWTRGILVEDVKVSGGGLRLLGPRGRRALLEIEGIDSRIDLERLAAGAEGVVRRPLGDVSVTRVSILGLMQMTGVHSPMQLRNDGALALPQITAKSDGGTVEGQVIADPRRSGLPFLVNVRCSGVGVASMSHRATSRVAFSRGSLEGNLVIEGFLRLTPSWKGQGRVTVKDAALARNGLLESFGRYVGLREFVELAFDEAETVFQVKGPVVWFDDIHWKTENLEFKGLGAAGMNQRAKLAARLYFSRRVREILQRIERQLPEQVVRKSDQVEGREDYYRDFVISGPFDDLRANFIGSEDRTLEEMLELLRQSGEESEKEPG